MLETILLTGFGPFGGQERNISEEAVRRLDGTELEGGFVLRALSLPVHFERAVAALEEALDGERPAAVLTFGPSDEPFFRVELTAKNERHYSRPDADGNVVRDAVVEESAPAMVFSTVPVAAIKQAYDEAGLTAELSEDGGRNVSNAIFYWTARHVAAAGFVHVPSSPDRLEEVVTAARLAAQVTARRLIAQRVEATA